MSGKPDMFYVWFSRQNALQQILLTNYCVNKNIINMAFTLHANSNVYGTQQDCDLQQRYSADHRQD